MMHTQFEGTVYFANVYAACVVYLRAQWRELYIYLRKYAIRVQRVNYGRYLRTPTRYLSYI